MAGIFLQVFFPAQNLSAEYYITHTLSPAPHHHHLKSQMVDPLEFGSSHEKFDDWSRPLSHKQYLFFQVQIGKRGKVQCLHVNCVHELFL